MMQPPRGYPEKIEQKVRNEVGSRSDPTTFNTENQYQTAQVIADMWPSQFKEMAAEAPVSRPIVGDVLEKFFGPADVDVTFSEIEEEFGSYDAYQRARRKGNAEKRLSDEEVEEEEEDISTLLDNPNLPDNVTKRDLEMYFLGRQEGFEFGFEHGWNARAGSDSDLDGDLPMDPRQKSGSVSQF